MGSLYPRELGWIATIFLGLVLAKRTTSGHLFWRNSPCLTKKRFGFDCNNLAVWGKRGTTFCLLISEHFQQLLTYIVRIFKVYSRCTGQVSVCLMVFLANIDRPRSKAQRGRVARARGQSGNWLRVFSWGWISMPYRVGGGSGWYRIWKEPRRWNDESQQVQRCGSENL